MSELTFLPWCRSGVAAALNAAAVAGGVNRAHLDVSLSVTDRAAGSSTPVELAWRMMGPGDVVGIDRTRVIRTEPSDGATGVETQIFPAVEFDDPSLPWLLSPVVEDASHRLRPWVCLVVVADQPSVRLDTANGILRIANPRDELPDLAEASAWAHVQYAGSLSPGSTPSDAVAALTGNPAAVLSRLLSPRRLDANGKRYFACVVPTYLAGVQAGLGGQPTADDRLADAWTLDQASVTLPVYYSFTFTTGPEGDFKSLAQALAHRPGVTQTGPDGLAERTLDLTRAGFTWPQGAPTSVALPGVLKPANAPAMGPNPQALADGLKTELTPRGAAPELRAPLYGSVEAGVRRADLLGTSPLPVWLAELNDDPRLRVAAGLGAQVVAAEQQQIVAGAWQQVEQAREVNVALSRAQLARLVTGRQTTRHLSGSDAVSLLQRTSPQATRMALGVSAGRGAAAVGAGAPVGTPWAIVRGADQPTALAAVVSAPYRRLTRPRARRAPGLSPLPATSVTVAQLRAALDPAQNVPRRVIGERIAAAASATVAGRPDPLRELAVPVAFRSGMVGPLARLAPDAVLPGAGSIPQNTALTLASEPAVLAAYMVGVNSEANRELLWHGVPIDRRDTPFRFFWDGRGQSPATTPDLPQPISTWDAGKGLAVQVGATPRLVLLIRAELLRRYPRTAVYAVRAKAAAGGGHVLDDETKPENVRQPSFGATLPPDLRVFGFDLDPGEAIASPGWFFVLQEQASETRFGSQATTQQSYWKLADLTLAGNANSATVADAVRLPPVRCAIHARALLPSTGA